MSQYKVELLSIAEAELLEAYDWYNEKQTGLGNRFIKEISINLDKISSTPYRFPAKHNNDLRFIPLKIFPYLISYWIDENLKTVFVLSIFHTSRNPDKFEL